MYTMLLGIGGAEQRAFLFRPNAKTDLAGISMFLTKQRLEDQESLHFVFVAWQAKWPDSIHISLQGPRRYVSVLFRAGTAKLDKAWV